MFKGFLWFGSDSVEMRWVVTVPLGSCRLHQAARSRNEWMALENSGGFELCELRRNCWRRSCNHQCSDGKMRERSAAWFSKIGDWIIFMQSSKDLFCHMRFGMITFTFTFLLLCQCYTTKMYERASSPTGTAYR